MANLLTLAIVLAVIAVTARHLQVRWRTGSAGDALLVAYRKVWPSRPLTWAELDQRIWRRMCGSITAGVAGHIIVPANFLVALSGSDFDRIGHGRTAMQDHLAGEMRKRATSKGWRIAQGPVVTLTRDPDVYDGVPRVDHFFGDVPAPAEASGPDARTRVFTEPAHHRPVSVPRQTGPAPEVPATAADPRSDAQQTERWIPDQADQLQLETVAMTSCRLLGPGGIDVALTPRSGTVRLGRHRDATVMLTEPVVSTQHARLEFRRGTWWLIDDGSRNGTRVDDRPVVPGDAGAVALADGSRIRFGTSGPELTFRRREVDLTDPPGDDDA